jgi:SAM-dependent methyltransferase
MAIEVLRSRSENKGTRAEMRRRNIDCTSSIVLRIARKIGLIKGVSVGSYYKSWDVLKTIQFLQDHVAREAPILDIGAYASEMLCALHRLDYTNLTGVDLNPRLKQMPYADRITYVIGDFLQSPFEDASFAAITAISVVEHGFDAKKLLTEIARLMKPGGYFIGSVDYWPSKIDTTGMNVFGMDWKIFSEDEIRSFIKEAETYGFMPCGELHLDASEPAISWQGKQYTFAWFALRKTA